MVTGEGCGGILPTEDHGAKIHWPARPGHSSKARQPGSELSRLYEEHYARVETHREASGMRVARLGSAEMLGSLVNERAIEPPCASRSAACLQRHRRIAPNRDWQINAA
jgi:hypothetical protein